MNAFFVSLTYFLQKLYNKYISAELLYFAFFNLISIAYTE